MGIYANEISTTHQFVLDDEAQAHTLMDEYRRKAASEGYTVKKCNCERKEKKSKGEVIAVRYLVTVTQVFDTIWGDLDE